MFLDKKDGLFKTLAYVRGQRTFKGTAESGYEFLMITDALTHPAISGSPAKVFKAPSGGTIQLSVLARMQVAEKSVTKVGLAIYLNGNKIWPSGNYQVLGQEELLLREKIQVQKNDQIAVVIDCIDGNTSLRFPHPECLRALPGSK